MTYQTTALSPATAGGEKLLSDTLATVEGAAAPASAVAALNKIGTGGPGVFNSVSDDNPWPTKLVLIKTGLPAALIDTSAAGDVIVINGVAGQTIRVHSLVLFTHASNTLELRSSATSLLKPASFAGVGSAQFERQEVPHFVCAAGESLVLNLGTAARVTGRVEYVQGA
jgi:hypothetical protein